MSRTSASQPPLGDAGRQRDGRERNLALRGLAAQRWLEMRGWRNDAEHPTLRLQADSISWEHFQLRRVWHAGGPLFRRRSDQRTITLRILLMIEGRAELSEDGSESAFGAGQALVVYDAPGARSDLRIETGETAAHIEITRELVSEPVGVSSAPLLTNVDSPLFLLLARLANEVLSSDITARSAGSPHVVTSVESLAWALIASSRPAHRSEAESGYAPTIYRKGLEAISDLYADPRTGVSAIARRLGVSESHVQRAFREMGTTAHAELQRTRARHAYRVLTAQSSGAMDAEHAARLSGFNSATVMRRVIRRVRAVDSAARSEG